MESIGEVMTFSQYVKKGGSKVLGIESIQMWACTNEKCLTFCIKGWEFKDGDDVLGEETEENQI